MESISDFDKVLKYNGNEEVFQKYRDILNQDFDFTIIYSDLNNKDIKYKGQLKNGNYNGRGKLYDFTHICDGFFKDGKKWGFFQEYYLYNGKKTMKYEGLIIDGKYTGKGTLYENGKKIYEGYFKDDKYDGIGIEYFPNEKKWRKMEYKNNECLNVCFGVLYDEDNNEIYKGKLINQKPEKGESIKIFDKKGFKIYNGGFTEYKYNGFGILYYKSNNKVYYEGKFNMDLFENGKLYDPKGNVIYEGKFIDNFPEECNNITFYDLNEDIMFIGNFKKGKFNEYGKYYKGKNNLIFEGYYNLGIYEGKGILNIAEGYERYEGLFKNGKYTGSGKLYKYCCLYYEGEFEENKFNGKGVLYYTNGQKYFEGFFKNGEPIGNGVKYYDNGNKKLEGSFDTFNSFKGKYYSPDKELLYEGKINDEIPLDENIKIYNDYTYKIYYSEISNSESKEKCFEYCPQYYIINKEIKNIKEIKSKIHFLSFYSYTGKTALIQSLIHKKYIEITYFTVGFNYDILEYKYNNKICKLSLWDSQSLRFSTLPTAFIKKANICIFTINLFEDYKLDIFHFDNVKNSNNNIIIYLVANKVEFSNYNELNCQKSIDENRNYAKQFIKDKKIDKYFEVNNKTGEGIGDLFNNIVYDNELIENSKIITKEKIYKKNKKDCLIA